MDRISKITHPDRGAMQAAASHWDDVAKPLGSLGLLEEMIIAIAGIRGTADVRIDKRCTVVMCADNGVVSENITQSDSSVTEIVAAAIAEGTANVSRIAQTFLAKTVAVDIGMSAESVHGGVINRRIASGTKNIAEGAAMTNEQAQKAIAVGMDIVGELKETGVDIIATGEMGIGNTTTSSALASVLLDMPPEAVTGRGAGLDDIRLERKINVIKRAIAVNRPDADKPVELLAKLGGFDIAGMTGLFLGGAYYRLPVIIDGLISSVAAVLAVKINPLAAQYMLPSHVSEEPAAAMLLDNIGMKAPIRANLRLGEGTGAVLLLPMLDGALAVYRSAHRFDELPMERYVRL